MAVEKWFRRVFLHDSDGNPISDTNPQPIKFIDSTGKELLLESNNAMPVNIQDQHTPVVIAKFNQVHNSTALSSVTAVDDLTIVVDSATGIVVGSYIILFDPTSVRFYTGTATGVGGTTITLDTPLDFAYPVGTFVDVAVTNMNVDGSGTTQIFGLRGVGTPPGIALEVDVTRVIFTMITADPISLSLFGDLAKLANGLVLRKRDGTYNNIFNVKDNRELANLMYDFTASVATNPIQGENGFVSRLTFAGQSKIGVTVRLALGEDLEFLIQDDLNTAQTGSQITTFEVMAEGHIVTD